jgi:DNA primase
MIHTTTRPIDVEVIKRCHSIVDLAERHGVRLRRSGRCLVGLCPLHEETTPSFTLYPQQNSYFCFGCGAGGDVISLAIALEGHRWPPARRFREACAYLAGTLPATPVERPPAPPPALTERAAAILTAVATAYAAELGRARALLAALAAAGAGDPAARRERIADAGLAGAVAGLAYLRNRGVPDAATAAAGVGWCEGDALAALAGRHGWSAAELVELGLLRPDGGEAQVGRVVIPEVRDGRCVWLSGRRIAPGGAKYLGVRLPRRALGVAAAIGQRRVIIVEGPLDYLVGRGWGLPVVALGGQGLAAADLAGLRAATDVALLLDADEAGRAEAARLRALLGARARVVRPPPPAKDLADLALLPDGRARLAAALAGD